MNGANLLKMVMSRLKIKSVFNLILIFPIIGCLFSNAIYLNDYQNPKWYLVTSYLMNEDFKDLYDYNFDIRYSKKNIEFSYNYYVNKQNLLLNDNRDNVFNIISFKYYYKNKNFIIGSFLNNYKNYQNLDDLYSLTFLFGKHFFGLENDLDYYLYIKNEKGFDETLMFVPDFLYLGCIIKDDDLFVEPFIRINNINKERYTGIKLGIEI